MWTAIIRWITGDLVGQLADAYKTAREGETEDKRIAATVQIKSIEAAMASRAESASVIKEGMQHKAFWIPWLIVSVPASMWAGWGYMDSLFNGALPDVAALPPQLKEYADIVFANIFYTGAGMGAAQTISAALRARK
ncbi:hypothetical protein [Pseudohoeflea suaedae]|uniref:hypothetical protein n=1 Tax=Pseudohoeflea suaedae TaxID=877384 RepID=UPI001882BE83|nr:hypothetical protein [Pseudohoeflea suaedae]